MLKEYASKGNSSPGLINSEPPFSFERDGQALAVWASGPTARPAHASAHLIDTDPDATLPCSFLLGRSDPADPLVSRQRRDIGPEARGHGIELDGISEICGQLMNRAVRELLSVHRSICVCFA